MLKLNDEEVLDQDKRNPYRIVGDIVDKAKPAILAIGSIAATVLAVAKKAPSVVNEVVKRLPR